MPELNIPLAPAQPDNLETPELVTELESAQELNGPKGLEPTRYGDWERKGRCVDF